MKYLFFKTAKVPEIYFIRNFYQGKVSKPSVLSCHLFLHIFTKKPAENRLFCK
jgi:hypothetical protein